MINKHPLSLRTLGSANQMRLPEFKNALGFPAHSMPDGSDWSVGDWFQALVGEVGEFAEVRLAFECGEIDAAEYFDKARRELADILTYLSLLASRALDVTEPAQIMDRSQLLMSCMANLGNYANSAKKFLRGDIDSATHSSERRMMLNQAHTDLETLYRVPLLPSHRSVVVHKTGIDLSEATVDKFNEVSARVGCNVSIDAKVDKVVLKYDNS